MKIKALFIDCSHRIGNQSKNQTLNETRKNYLKKTKMTRATAIPFDSNRKYYRIFEEWLSIVELRNEAVLAFR